MAQAPRSRLHPDAAAALRAAVAEASGVEVFAIGDVEDGVLVSVQITCRGREDRVNALIDRPRAGQVVIHNHPSGNLLPSDADMSLAHIYGENGVGFVIVDSLARRANWVVEPHRDIAEPVDDQALTAFFTQGLPKALDGWESRPAQIEMARSVARSFENNEPLVVEAGTGTGKSLAYLVPAALWAKANNAKVAISTYTRALQSQLLQSDLPLLERGGIDVRYAVLQGRNNYLCKRRLGLALDEDKELPHAERQPLEAIGGWASSTADGMRSDLTFSVDHGLWERVMSDSDLTLSTRCPHYAECHYYKARRQAAAADLLVVNHALLLSDRFLVDRLGHGMLPKVARVVLDEAHHLEDATTGAGAMRLTALAVRRAILPLLDRKRRRGGLARLVDRHAGKRSQLAPAQRSELVDRASVCQGNLNALAASIQHVTEQIAARCLQADGAPLRITPDYEQTQDWQMGVSPDIAHVAHELRSASEDLDAIEQLFTHLQLNEADAQPLLDLRRARRRLTDQADTAKAFLDMGPENVRWIEPARSRRGDKGAAICSAPIEVGPALRRVLWQPLPGTVNTSATLSVGGRFTYWERRHGLFKPNSERYPSPFDHAAQAILGLPRDIPPPDRPEYAEEVAKVMVDAIRISDGGAFILCTSYAAVRTFAAALRKAEPRRPIVVQGESGRAQLLRRFQENDRSVLVGTDSFWEGVSVRGRNLRLVMIPRLPFRVPTDPLRQARHETAKSKGLDPFLAYSLPEAVIKLRQGYGRLIRSKTDTGAVLILDRRVHDRRYGRVMLNSLPPARRVVGPWRRVAQALTDLYNPDK